jgi:hypothetical protein
VRDHAGGKRRRLRAGRAVRRDEGEQGRIGVRASFTVRRAGVDMGSRQPPLNGCEIDRHVENS